MDFYTRARAVGGAAKMSNKKDVKIPFLKRGGIMSFSMENIG